MIDVCVFIIGGVSYLTFGFGAILFNGMIYSDRRVWHLLTWPKFMIR
jgi:hypothetical protein